MQIKPVSTRERGRASVWEDIHTAALDIAESEGMAAATIDRISVAAGISRRTFFNYFPTKEAAILGIREPEATPEMLAALEDDSIDTLTKTVRFVAGLYGLARVATADGQRRKTVVQKFPDLSRDFILMKLDIVKFAQPYIQPLFAHGKNSGVDEARIMVATANAILIAEYKRDPSSAFSNTDEYIRTAISNFRKAMATSL